MKSFESNKCHKCKVELTVENCYAKKRLCKECLSIQNKELYEKIREIIIKCECGLDVKKVNYKHHQITNKHKKRIEGKSFSQTC